MGTAHKPSADAAIQYLTWAIEEIEQTGDQETCRHARAALERLQCIYSRRPPASTDERSAVR